MPERFNFAILVEGPSALAQRISFLDESSRLFRPWLNQPREVMLFNIRSGVARTMAWQEAHQAIHGRLARDELLFVYIDSQHDQLTSVVSILEHGNRTEYTISLPDMEIENRPSEIETRLMDLVRWALGTTRKWLIVAGGEVEIEDDWSSVDSGVRGAGEPTSLVTWICCRKDSLPHTPAGFRSAAVIGDATLLHR